MTMGYAIVIGTCIACKQTFGFNPHRVPSITVNGNREPVCSNCLARRNQYRAEQGLPPDEALPGAYEPIEESEL
jgi:hypothetical protein